MSSLDPFFSNLLFLLFIAFLIVVSNNKLNKTNIFISGAINDFMTIECIFKFNKNHKMFEEYLDTMIFKYNDN